MAEARDYLGTLATKKLDNTGVTEDHLRGMKPGTHRVLIVEVAVDEVGDKQNGQTKVKLVANLVELVPAAQEDTVREFMRALRDTRGGDVAISGTESGGVEGAATAMAAQIDRDDDGKPTGKGIWYGDLDAPLHGAGGQAQVTLPGPAGNPFSVVQGGDDQEPCPDPECVLPQHDDGDHQTAQDG